MRRKTHCPYCSRNLLLPENVRAGASGICVTCGGRFYLKDKITGLYVLKAEDCSPSEFRAARRRGRKRSFFDKFSFYLIRLPLIVALVVALVGVALWSWVPSLQKMNEAHGSLQFDVQYDGENLEMIDYVSNLHVEYQDIPEHVIKYLLYQEDRGFYEHKGFDIRGIARAIVRRRGGGSTISQQLAKNLILSGQRSYLRKMKELVLAIKLEAKYSKEEILVMYLNQVGFGNGYDGIQSAARGYFKKNSSNLTHFEAALLISSLPCEAKCNIGSNELRARERATRLMVRANIDINTPSPADTGTSIVLGNKEYIDVDERSIFDALRYSIKDALNGAQGRFIVVTTIDPAAQMYAELAAIRFRQEAKTNNLATDQFSLVALENRSREVRAMIPTLDRSRSQVDHAIRLRRQIGSLIKPFIALEAFEQGKDENTIIDASNRSFGDGRYVKNHDGVYQSDLTIREMLLRSSNTGATKLLIEIGLIDMRNYARVFNFKFSDDAELSMALGVFESSPLDVAAAYSMIPNYGQYVRPRLIRFIRKRDGTLAYDASTIIREKIVVASKGASEKLWAILREVISNGTGHRASFEVGGVVPAGKTGTSQNNVDAWFAGFTGSYTAVIWAGNTDGSPTNGLYGGSYPAVRWGNFMANLALLESEK